MGGRRRIAIIADQRVDAGVDVSSAADEVDTSTDHRFRKSKETALEEWGMGYRSNTNRNGNIDGGRRLDWFTFIYDFVNDIRRLIFNVFVKIIRILPSRRIISTLFIVYLSLLNTVTADRPSSCHVDNCANTFTRDYQMEKVTFSANIANCVLLTNYAECLSRTARSCRGNLRYHSLRTMVLNSKKDFNCTTVISEHKSLNNGELKPKSTLDDSNSSSSSSSNVVDQRAGRCLFPYHHQKGASGYRYCSAFGDPHIRTFDGQHETCKTVGAWPLLDNAYLNVQLMNEALVPGLDASGITKISVIIKALPGCTDQKTFTATTDSLPSSFDDGTIHSGEPSVSNGDTFRYHYDSSMNGGGGEPSRIPPAVFIQTLKMDERIELHLRYVATRVVVRRTGNYLSVAIKMPEDALSQESSFSTWQLCLAGCPSSEKINYKEILAYPDYYLAKFGSVKPFMNRETAVTLCRDANLTDFFFDSCVFDMLTTGDVSFRDAAQSALEDIRHMYPPYAKHYETNRSDLRLYDELARLARERETNERQRYHRQNAYSVASNASRTSLVVSPTIIIVFVYIIRQLFATR